MKNDSLLAVVAQIDQTSSQSGVSIISQPKVMLIYQDCRSY